ncbi:Putative zinc-finger [Paenibacillus tianmuensis]|uniref:Putative zinc-finger n=1 Tax=Paenibacillus tianmuensis TaxID=624147 RepID=A0A1G4QTE1_9BACL|nr:zf-HC2 domain-containing protein [Paenibacillus tianmuensis]SCW47924.1 Putative zinc-finger [Paenibacillus tianmuensis]
MMCQEVIELMQRHLDRDLDETEYGRMLQHLQQCPDCTGLFERLVNLSNELECLPKVTPPFSLVDAILPKLEQLEAAGTAPDAASGKIERETEALRAAAAADPSDERPAWGSWRKNVREWISFPVFGGVVAVGLVLGFFLFQSQQSNPESDAGRLLLSMTDKKAESEGLPAAGQATEAVKSKPAAQTGGKAEQSLPAGGSDNKAASQEHKPQNSSAGSGDTNKEVSVQSRSSDAADADRSTSQTAVPRQQTPGGKTVETEQLVREKQPKAPVEKRFSAAVPSQQPASPPGEDKGISPENGNHEQAKGFIASEPSQPSEEAVASESADTGEGATDNQPRPESTAKKNGGSSMGISAKPDSKPAVHELASPDEKYKASVREEKIVIVDKDGKEVYASGYNWKGADRIDLVEWSGDGKLTYRVMMAEQSKTFIIDLKAKTETEVKPSKP